MLLSGLFFFIFSLCFPFLEKPCHTTVGKRATCLTAHSIIKMIHKYEVIGQGEEHHLMPEIYCVSEPLNQVSSHECHHLKCYFVWYFFCSYVSFCKPHCSSVQVSLSCCVCRCGFCLVQTGCVSPLRESFQTMPWRPDGQEETHGPESVDSSIDAYWLLSQATKARRWVCAACTCASLCVCVFEAQREKKIKEKKKAQTERKSQTIWAGLSQLAVKVDFREFGVCSPTCSPSHSPGDVSPQTPLHFPDSACLCPSMKRPHAAQRALAPTQVQVKVICLTHTHAPAQTNERTGEQPECFDTLSCAAVNGVAAQLRQSVWLRVVLPNPFVLLWL